MSWKKDTAYIIVTSIASYLLMAMVYPDLLIHHIIYFSQNHDTEVPFLSAFTLISNYYHGGIQLWNPYDQMTYFFHHLGNGLYTIASIITAATYILLASFFEYPGEAFQSIHSICFHSTTILIRTIGGYLLLRRFKVNPVLIFASLIYLNTFLVNRETLGFLVTNLYSFLPLLLYFMLRFFEGFRLNDFLASLIVMTLAVANSPLLALSYFYQAVHFYMLFGLVWAWFLADTPSIKSIYHYAKGAATIKNLIKIFVVGSLCLAIMLPYLKMERTLQTDFYIPEAFEEDASGRMTNKYSIKKYFSKPVMSEQFGSFKPSEFLLKSVDFNTNHVYWDWWFLGFSTFLFAGMGLIFSKDKRKHFFIWPVLLIIGLLFPRDPSSLLSIAHWINVLTNPLQYLCREFAMTANLIPYFFLPLIAIGMQSLKELIYYNKPDSIHFNRVSLGILFLVTCLAYFSFCLPEKGDLLTAAVKSCLYALIILIIFIWATWESRKVGFLFSVTKHRSSIVILGISLMFLLDLPLFSIYMSKNQLTHVRIFAGNSNHMADRGLVNTAYQNPETLPFREFYSLYDKEMIIFHPEAREKHKIENMVNAHPQGPFQDPEFVSWYRLNSRQDPYGHFYKFTHLGRYFFPPTIYHPRHIAYKNLFTDTESQNYLKNDHRIIFQAKYAFDSNQLNHSQGYKDKIFSQVGHTDSNANLTNLINNRSLVSIEAMGEKIPNDLSESSINLNEMVQNRQGSQHFSTYLFPLENGQTRRSNRLIQYSFKLHSEFPSFISTSVFTKDQFNMKVSIGDQKLKPAQGKLVRPFTYDLQNVSTGKLTILLPDKYNIKNRSATLKLKQNPEIINIWKNENDNLGINYSAPRDGWLILHFPYDERWKVTINEKPAKIYRANKYFIGFPIQQGKHKILIQYWPDTNLRAMIELSMFLIIISFPGLVTAGILAENSGTKLHYSLS